MVSPRGNVSKMKISVQLGPNAPPRIQAVCEFFGLTPDRIFREAPGFVAAIIRDVTEHGASLVAYRPAGEVMSTDFMDLPTLEDFRKNDHVHAIPMSPAEIGGLPVPAGVVDVTIDPRHLQEINSYVKANDATEAYTFCLWAFLSALRTAAKREASLGILDSDQRNVRAIVRRPSTSSDGPSPLHGPTPPGV